MDFAIDSKLAQTVFPGGDADLGSFPFETQTFQCLNTGNSNLRLLSFYVQPVLTPLALNPISQLGAFAEAFRNVAVSMDFTIVGKSSYRWSSQEVETLQCRLSCDGSFRGQ
jgi:hypothetical protein